MESLCSDVCDGRRWIYEFFMEVKVMLLLYGMGLRVMQKGRRGKFFLSFSFPFFFVFSGNEREMNFLLVHMKIERGFVIGKGCPLCSDWRVRFFFPCYTLSIHTRVK